MTTRTLREHKLMQRESLFHANCFGNISAAGGTINFHLKNPSGSGVRIIITDVKVTSKGPTTVSTPHGMTVDTDGSALDVDNVAIGSTKTSSAEAYKDATYSSVDHTHEEYIGSGGAGFLRPPHGGDQSDIGSVVKPGQSYIVELTNDDSSNAHDMSITVEFYEVPT